MQVSAICAFKMTDKPIIIQFKCEEGNSLGQMHMRNIK